MKKSFLRLTSLLLLAALSLVPSSLMAEPISLTRAKSIANAYVKEGGMPALVQLTQVHKVKQNLIAGQPTQSYYVFNRGVGEGFVIVSGNDLLPEVIGYTDKGDFVYDQMPPALQDMLAYYAAAADSLNALASDPTVQQPQKVVRKATGTKSISPLMTSTWHQSGPYNDLCPKITQNGSGTALTGCVATATSQILYYWRKDCNDRSQSTTPTYGYGDAPVTAEYQIPKNTPFKWDLMQDNYNGSTTAESRKAAATLNAVVGMSGWLTYGSSTSGQIDNMRGVISGQFGLNGGTTVWKSSYTQTNWEKQIINDLEKGYPVLYSGVHPDNGGHAVVVDGYNVTTNKFHFNFGWGGQANGYYTVDDVTGMNGFCEGQGMVHNIYASKPNLDATLIYAPDTLLQKVNNEVVYRITNNGTLPVSGFSLYCANSTSTTLPSTASDQDKTTVIQPGESADFTFSCSPSSSSGCRITLTDANKTAYCRTVLPVKISKGDFTLSSLRVDDGCVVKNEQLGDQTVAVCDVHNSTLNIAANLTNSATSTKCCPSIKIQYQVVNPTTGIAGTTKTRTKSNVTFDAGQQQDVSFQLTGLNQDSIYRISIVPSATVSSKQSVINFATADTVLYCRILPADLTGVYTQDSTEMKFTGHYDKTTFANIATDPSVSRYDMTEVDGLSPYISAANPNALFYVKASQQVAGRNIVADGVTDTLDVQPGYDFQPREDLTALRAIYHLTQAVGQYGTAVLPFTATVPSGVYAHKVNEVKSYALVTDSVDAEMKAGTPYLVLSGEPVDIIADKVTVTTKVASEGVAEFCGTYVNQTATSAHYLITTGASPKFATSIGTTIPALTAYMTTPTSSIYSNESTHKLREQKALALAQQIQSAVSVLKGEAIFTSASAQRALSQCIIAAEDTLKIQRDKSSQVAATDSLKAAIEAYESSYYLMSDSAYLDVTSLIANPSFELSSLSVWKRSSATAVPYLTFKSNSDANFMSHADGTRYAQVKAGATIQQTITDVPNGTYKLVVAATAQEDEQEATLCAVTAQDSITTAVVGNDFGDYYLHDVQIYDIHVTDHNLVIRANGGASGWMKVDNFRLYQKECTDVPTGIQTVAIPTNSAPALQGVFDLTGRRVNDNAFQRGIFIVNGRKLIR